MSESVEISSNVIKLIRDLADQIGTTVDKIFPWYVQQQQLQGGIFLFITTSCLIMGLVGFLKFVKTADFNKGNADSFLVVIFAIISTLSVVMFVANGVNAITQLVNPNYHAVHALIKDFSNLR